MARYRGTMAQQVLRLPVFAAGMPARERLLKGLSPAASQWMHSTLLANEWIDEALAVELSNAVVRALNLDTDEAVQSWFRRQHIQGFAGMLRQAGIRTPEQLFAAMPAMWARQHDTGSLQISEQTTRSAVLSMRDNAASFDRVHGLALQGGTEGFLTLAGAIGVRSTRRPARAEVIFAYTWDEVAIRPDGG